MAENVSVSKSLLADILNTALDNIDQVEAEFSDGFDSESYEEDREKIRLLAKQAEITLIYGKVE